MTKQTPPMSEGKTVKRSECRCLCHIGRPVRHWAPCCEPVMDAQPATMDETMDADDWTPDPRTVQACIEALPNSHVTKGILGTQQNEPAYAYEYRARAALEALLPKPTLAEQWMEQSDWPDMGVQVAVEEFERWLVSKGMVRL